MKSNLFSFALLFFSITLNANTVYEDDILPGFEQVTIQQPDDYEGKVVTTLIRKKADSVSTKAVLYIHGYCDYFFQTDLAKAFIDSNYNFYAVDLRKYGRSLLPNQTPNICYKVEEYFPDLDSCLARISSEGNKEIVLLAHSTGGLISSLYLKERKPDNINGFVLNSPFFDMNQGWFMDEIVVPIASWLANFFPKIKVPMSSGAMYGKSVHVSEKGEWQYNLEYKPMKCFDMNWGWVRAIHKAQKQVQKGIKTNIPVEVLASDKSIIPDKEWKEEYHTADIVLDVKDIKKYSAKITGSNYVEIKDARHDVFLSTEEARILAYKKMFSWLKENNL